MNLRKKLVNIILSIIILIIIYFLFSREAKSKNHFDDIKLSYRTPIEFYGKVVNQYGSPVEGASVTLEPINKLNDEIAEKIILKSDKDGRFSVKGQMGIALAVQVSKDGYMTFPQGVGKRFSSLLAEYGLSNTKGVEFKNSEKPIFFTLHEIGPVEPMAYVERKNWKLPVDGSPVRIALDSESGKGAHKIDFRFESGWNKLPMDNDINKKKYDWKLEMRIPGGGFRDNPSEYSFEAPEEGYQEGVVIEYRESMSEEEWKRTTFRRFFVKFADGSYGRIRFGIDGGTDSRPLEMTSWLSLRPGSRNLASDKWDPTVVSDE